MNGAIRSRVPGTTARLRTLAAAAAACYLTGSAVAAADQTVTVDGTGTGRTFDGMGAVSGGGATSVLLRDYVEPQRSQILDYLFKPNFGANMSELYIEIPGDGNSTQGSELSHMHTSTDENYYRGYEWWLMEQARARNPAIYLDATPWSGPSWVGTNNNLFTQTMATYVSKWLAGAKTYHNLDVNYVGCRNEKGTSEPYAELLRTTLNGDGLTSVGIHAFDNWGATSWNWVPDMKTNATLSSAIYAIGSHTTSNPPGASGSPPPADVIADGHPIWDTEEHVYEHGFQCAIDIIRYFNYNYINSKITKTIYWYLITAFYSNETFYDVTTGVASTPWSGSYTVNPALWGYAHVGQFTKTGWKFLDAASGNLTNGGSYVTMMSPSGGDFSVIAQTYQATATQNVTFNVTGGLSTGTVSVWSSNATAMFEKQASVTQTNGAFTVAMAPNTIYSITTTTGQQKGSYTPPAAAAFPFPYYENYDHYNSDFSSVGYRPYYHADIAGGFELYDRPDGTGQCLRQVVNPPANAWGVEWNPFTIVGDPTWTDYEVSADVSVEDATGWASIMGRVNSAGNGYDATPSAYYMSLTQAGGWSFNTITYGGSGNVVKQLASGTATLLAGTFHNLKLVFSGTSIKGSVDATQVFSITDGTYKSGSVGLGTQSGHNAMFDNLIVNAVGGATPTPTVFPQDAQNPPDGGAPTDAGGASSGGSATSSSGGSSSSGTTSSSGVTASSGGSSSGTKTGSSSGSSSGSTASSGGSSSGAKMGSSSGSSSGSTAGSSSGSTAGSSSGSAAGSSSGSAAGSSGGSTAGSSSGSTAGSSGGSTAGSSGGSTAGSSSGSTAGSSSGSAAGSSSGSTAADAGTAGTGNSSNGCSCRTAGGHGGRDGLGGLLLAGTVVLGRRRRRGRTDSREETKAVSDEAST
ncbi:MAG: galactosylceramidase [Polyangiaceae bacterium]|jgi:galactosylceramidase